MTQTPETVETDIAAKEERLKSIIAGYGSIVVAYSGGVDSTYLADVAHEVLGHDASILIADSPSIPRSELAEATALARERGWRLEVVRTQEFENEDYLKNDGARCYHCRVELFTMMRRYAEEQGGTALAYGANTDDLLDPTRLGAVAAKEKGVVAPLQDAGLTKAEIRQLSARRSLPTSDKASFACLSSRFPKGTRVTLSDMAKVEAAEEVLKACGFHQYRARHHGDLCRIELDSDGLARALDADLRQRLVREIRKIGYRFVTLDLACYRTGSSA